MAGQAHVVPGDGWRAEAPLPVVPAAAPAVARASGWLVSPPVDLGFILLGGIVTSLVLSVSMMVPAGFLTLAVLFAIVADFPHVLQTYARVLMDPDEYRLYGRHFWQSLLVVAGVVGWLLLFGDLLTIVMIWVYWQPLHVIKQHDGMVGIYAAKSGRRGPRTLARVTLFLGCLAPILYRISTHGLRFGDYEVFGWRMPISGMDVPVPPVSEAVVLLAYLTFAGAFVLFVREQAGRWREGRALPKIALANLGAALVTYNLAYLLVSDLYAVILIATAVHSLQYHALCWARNHRKFGLAPSAPASAPATPPAHAAARLLAFLSQRGHVAYYVAAIVAAGAALASLEPLVFGLPLIIVLHHFYLDGVIWKGKANPALARDLGLDTGRA